MIKGIVSTYDNLSLLPILKKAPPNPNTKAANVNFDRSKKYFAIFSFRIFTNSRASLILFSPSFKITHDKNSIYISHPILFH